MNNTAKENPVFLAQVASHMLTHYGDDLRRVAVVFNNQRPIQYLKKQLADQHARVLWSPQFFTIQDFLRLSTPRKEINQTAQLFLLHQLHTAIQRQQNPAFEESLDHFFPLAEIILDDFAQLDYELVNVDAIFQELSEIALLDRQFDFLTEEQQQFLIRFWSAFSKDQHSEMQARFLHLWRLLPQLYRYFKSALQERDQHTIAGIYRDLAEQKPGTLDPAAAYDQVLFVGFNALNACEVRLFKEWQSIGKATFYFDADTYYFDDPQMEAGHFIRQSMSEHGLINALGEVPSWISPDGTQGQIRLIAAPGYTAQSKILAQLLRDQPPATSAAVILADESLLVPVLQSIPAQQKINITMGYPMVESLTYSMIDLILEAQLDFAAAPRHQQATMDHALLIDFIGHPFTACLPETRLKLARDLAEHQETRLALTHISSLIPGQYEEFQVFFNRAKNVSDLLNSLLHFLDTLSQSQEILSTYHQIEWSLMENALQALRQMQPGLEIQQDLSISLAIKLIRRQLNKLTTTLSGDPLEGLQIMGLLESRNLNFDVIYLLGANEGNLPALQSGASFIPYNLRRAYRLPVIENQQALSAYLFYRLLHGFDQFNLIYNAVVDEQSSGEISRFARQIQYESRLDVRNIPVSVKARKKSSTTEQDLVSAENHPLASAQIPAASSEDRPIRIQKTGKIWERLSHYLKGAPVENRKSLSASAFTMYINSPLEFFFRYIAHIKEPPRLTTELESNRIGSIIHRTMELAYQPFLTEPHALTPQDITRILEQLPALCERAVAEEFYKGHQNITATDFSGQERIILRIAQEYCRLFLEHDRNLGTPVHLVEMENDEDYLLEFPILAAGQKNSVVLRGIIDRVDEVNGQKRIVDYKTGGDTLEIKGRIKEGPDEDPQVDFDYFHKNWKDSNKAFIQTMFYTYIYEQLSGSEAVEPHLYSVRKMRNEGTVFRIRVPYRGTHELTGELLAGAKSKFLVFLREKLEELFNPDIPFEHPPEATVYPNSPYGDYLINRLDFGGETGEHSPESQ